MRCNQEQINIPSWPGFGLITFNSTIRCFIWSGSLADISQSPSPPRDGDNAEMMRILLPHLCCPHLAEERRLELLNFHIDVHYIHNIQKRQHLLLVTDCINRF